MTVSRDAFVIDQPRPTAVAVAGGGRFPVRRIFCIGRNYADHVREMGADPKSSPPVFFTKPADAVVESGATIPYPLGTDELHFEGELVLALKSGARNMRDAADAAALIFGMAAGCDLTRRDLQAAAKKSGGPWDAAKAFDHSAPVGPIARMETIAGDFFVGDAVTLAVNGAPRQRGALKDMIWSAPEIILALSRLFELQAGDLIFTGTPEGVGPLAVGDTVVVEIGPLPALRFSIGPRL